MVYKDREMQNALSLKHPPNVQEEKSPRFLVIEL